MFSSRFDCLSVCGITGKGKNVLVQVRMQDLFSPSLHKIFIDFSVIHGS